MVRHVDTSKPLFKEKTIIRVRSFFLGQRINLKSFENAEKLAASPLMIAAGAEGYVVMFRFGAIVLFNMDPIEEVSFLSAVTPLISEPYDNPEKDQADIMVDPGEADKVGEKYVQMQNSSVGHIQILGEVMAKNVTLSYYENNISQIISRIEPMAEELHRKGRTARKSKELLGHIGESLLIQSKITGKFQIDEKPDLLWDRPDLERLYAQLESEYEIRERVIILRHKLDLIHQTVETLLGLLQDKRTLHVEWYIVILILFEIIMSLFEKLLH